MAEYINRDEVMKAFADYVRHSNNSDLAPTPQWNNAVKIVENIKTADVMSVVFCKDCRHRDPEDHKCDSGQLERAGCIFPVADDYYCAYGEV